MVVSRVIGYFHYRTVDALDEDAVHSLFERLCQHCSYADSKLPLIRDFTRLASKSKNMLPIIVESEPDGVLIGTCAFFNRVKSGKIELIGYFEPVFEGTETLLNAARNLISLARELFPMKKINIRIDESDHAKRTLAEHCGAEFIMLCDTIEAEYSKLLLAERGDRNDELQNELMMIIKAGENKVVLYNIN